MKKTRKGQKKKLDAVFSEYIRKRDSDQYGYGTCITCGKRQHWKELDAGHYVSRYHNATRFEDKNVHAQCKVCNRFKNGQPDEYALSLQKKYGDDILDHLNQLKHTTSKWSLKDYEDAIAHYKEEIEYMDTGKRKCPYCGNWYKNLESHVNTSCS